MYSGFIRDLKQRRRRTTTTTSLTIGFMSKTTALHVHHAFKYISLTSTARLRRETSQCDVLWRTRTYYDKFSLLYLNMDKALNYEFNSRKSRLHLTNWAVPNRRDKVWKNANSIFRQWCFHYRFRRLCLRSLVYCFSVDHSNHGVNTPMYYRKFSFKPSISNKPPFSGEES